MQKNRIRIHPDRICKRAENIVTPLSPHPSLYIFLVTFLVLILLPNLCQAINLPTITFGIQEAERPAEASTALQIIFLLTIMSVAPSIILMMTCFTRIAIVFGFLRQAMGTQSMPPTQIIMGLSLFLTFYIMSPTISKINEDAIKPYMAEEITQQAALDRAIKPMREFMFSQVKEEELALLSEITLDDDPQNRDDIPTLTLIPAFMLSELKTAFQMGFLIYVPFLVIDMIVASILMSMGMMMLPPIIISMPFKLLLFVLVDGWGLMVGSLLKSFS